ncbi:MAG: hypothetical protein HQM09_00105 [Candidatus Riflebacteria bacterium]|nr:hypothetical protein [Candidatus Riflebacteria bacterium]
MSRFSAICILAVLILFPLTAQAQEPQPASGFVPKWTVGDQWTLQASYRDLKNASEPWLPPVRWVFRVKAIKNIFRMDCYVIHVFPQDARLKMQAVLYLAVRDLRPVRVIDIFPTAQGVKNRIRDLDPMHPTPLLNEDSMVPYDMPVFPLMRMTTQRADGFAGYTEPEARNFDKIATYGVFKFKRNVAQTGKQPERRYADSFATYRSMATGESFQVELADSGPTGTLTQLWQEGAPWAISSENSARKIWLVPAGPSKVTPAATPRASQGGAQ